MVFVSIKSQISGDKNIQLYDVMGRQVLSTVLKSDKLNVSTVKSGLYMLKVFNKTKSSTIKLIVN